MTAHIQSRDTERRIPRLGAWLKFKFNQVTRPRAATLLPVHGLRGPTAEVVPIAFGPEGPGTAVEIKVVSAKGNGDSGNAEDVGVVAVAPT